MTAAARCACIALLGQAVACGPTPPDRTSPGLTSLSVVNSLARQQREDCATGSGVRVTDSDGKITFSSSDHGAPPRAVTWTCTRTGVSNDGPISCGPGATADCNCTPTHGYEFTALRGGVYTLTITATDASGNSASQSISWEVDDTAPTVTFSSPPFTTRASFPAVVSLGGQGVIAGFSVTDGGTLGVTQARCLVDGMQLPSGQCSFSAGTYVLDGALAEGEHTSTVEVTDCAGNTSSASNVFQVDRAAPIQGRAPTFAWPHVSFTLEDATTRVESAVCSVDGTEVACGVGTLPANPYSGEGDLSGAGLSPGLHQFSYTAHDFFGHEASFGPFDFVVPVMGQLDTSFGGGTGIVTTAIDSTAHAVAIQVDGKILVAGGGDSGTGATVVRYQANGGLDSTFGGDGIVSLPDGTATQSGMSVATGLALDASGNIVVSGIGSKGGYFRMTAARLHSDGSLDTSFGTAGDGHIFFSPFTSNGSYGAQDVAIQGDGKIVLGGETADRFAVVRLTTEGLLDTSFGGSGYVTTAMAGRYCHANSVAIQSNGSIVVSGQSYNSNPYGDYAVTLARYTPDGTLDSSFGTAGVVTSRAMSEGMDMVLQGDKILVCGEALVDSRSALSMLRFGADGTLDATFGDAGQATTLLQASDGSGSVDVGASAYAIALSGDRILLAGHADRYPSGWLAVARYSADGALDTSFHSPDGYVLTSIGASPWAYDLAIQSDGKIVAVGGQGRSPGQYIVARYVP